MKRVKARQRVWSVAFAAVVVAALAFGTIVQFTTRAAGVAGDVNKDGIVNVFDLSVVLNNWNTTSPTSDVNGDGMVNVFDLSVLLSNWNKTGPTPTPTVIVTATPTATVAPTPTQTPLTGGAACRTASSTQEQDIKLDDNHPDVREGRWTRAAGQEVTLSIALGAAPAKIVTAVQHAADVWSASNCFNLITSTSCATGMPCVKVVTRASSGDETDSEVECNESGSRATRTACNYVFYMDMLNPLSQSMANATAGREMGHIIGLEERATPNKLLYDITTANTERTPDAIDMTNILVIYGDKF